MKGQMAMPDSQRGGKDVDLAESLGVDSGVSAQCFSIYVPDKDRFGEEIGVQRKWVLEALRLLGEINGGATALPPSEGVWLNEEGTVIAEHPVVVYSYVVPEPFLQNLPRIREFLHRMGRETNQGEVAFEFDGRFYRIRHFDEE
jgi:hypothetical protein